MKHDLQRAPWAWTLGTGLVLALAAVDAGATALRPQCPSVLVAEQARLEMPVAGTDDLLGRAVSIDGNWAVVGAHSDNNAGGTDAGSVQIYRRTVSDWSHFAELRASNAQASDYFGVSVAIDGDVIVVGAHGENAGGTNNGGSAYVFELVSGAWIETAALTAPNPASLDYFGWDVDVSGETVLVAAHYLDAPGFTDTGAGFVFVKSAGSWALEDQLMPTLQNGMYFGTSVAIEGDTAVLGAPGHNIAGQVDQGSAFVFQRTGNTWMEVSNLTSPNGAPGDNLGYAVAIGGGRIAVGAYLADDAAGADQGEVTVFSQQFGLWSFEQQLLPSSASAGDQFGAGIALDGQTIVVSGHAVDALGTDSGAVYIYSHCGGVAPWTEKALFLPWESSPGDWFGFSVGISGSTVINGAHGFNGTGSNVGAAYINILSPGEFNSYGFGDGSGTPCPCSNDSVAGLGQGCLNSSGLGARLSAWGSDGADAADLTFVAGNLVPSVPALLFAGTNAIGGGNGIAFGDGLRVVGGPIQRLQVAVADPLGNASWGPFSSAQGGWGAGQTRYFQTWYRDPIGGPCTEGFNLTNGLQVDFQ